MYVILKGLELRVLSYVERTWVRVLCMPNCVLF